MLNNTNQSTNTNMYVNIPPELKITFEKLISQLDLVAKTTKIMDQRIQCLEGQISTLFNRVKKGFVQKQPPQMGDYQYLLENSNNFFPNNSLNNNELSQNINNQNSYDYHLDNVYKSDQNFKETMNLNNDENKQNVIQSEIDKNKTSQEKPNDEENIYKGQIQEEFGYNGEENQGEEQVNENNNDQDIEQKQYSQENEYMNEQEYEEGQGEEYEEGQGEEYEEGQGEEEYVNEEEYEQGEEYEEGQEQEQEMGEEQPEYDYKNEDMNDGNESPNK